MLWERELQRSDPVRTPAGDVVLTARTSGNGVRVGPAGVFRTAARPHSVEVVTPDGGRHSVRIRDTTGMIVTALRLVTALVVVWGVARRIRRRT